MRLRYLLYLLVLSVPVFFSCSDDAIVEPSTDTDISGNSELEEGVTYLDILLENPDIHTRDVSFEEGASIVINTFWLGVFDIKDGKCVEKVDTIQDYKFVTSGNTYHNALRIKFSGPKVIDGVDYKDHDLFMVAVANYKGVKARDAREAAENIDIEYELTTLLNKVQDWEDFNHIGIDTYTAYYENDHNMDAPLMAGFLNSTNAYNANVPSSTHIKINQFADLSGEDKVSLLPVTLPYSNQNLKTSLKIKWNGNTGVKRYVDEKAGATALEHTIFFRRLVANINIKVVLGKNYTGDDIPSGGLNFDEDLEITNVGYRRFNVPNNVYIIERTMLGTDGNFPTKGAVSPNFADIDPSRGYFNDDDNNESLTDNSDPEPKWYDGFKDDDGAWNLTFQHFANKHWARNTVNDYSDREAVDYDEGNNNKMYFTALCDPTLKSKDINNNASYFLLKMHLVNWKQNRCAEAEYRIHEGYTSDSDGYGEDGRNPGITYTEDETNKGYWDNHGGWNNLILKDFSTARNINYNYRIRVNKFDQIFVNVNGKDINGNVSQVRRHDQGGKAWQMVYAGETKTNGISDVHFKSQDNSYTKYISRNGGIFKNAIYIDNAKPDIAFRLFGYNSAAWDADNQTYGLIEGYNFNFPDNSFRWLDGLWPQSAHYSHYFKDYGALVEEYNKDKPQIDDRLYKTFRFIDAAHYDENNTDIYYNYDKDVNSDTYGQFIGYIDDEGNTYPENTNTRGYNLWWDLFDFITNVHLRDTRQKFFHIKVSPREVDWDRTRPESDYLRAIFISDRNGLYDDDQCSKLVNVYAAVQGIQ